MRRTSIKLKIKLDLTSSFLSSSSFILMKNNRNRNVLLCFEVNRRSAADIRCYYLEKS